MSSLLKIAAYFAGTLLLGALLAPPLFWAGHALGARVDSLRWLAATDFQRYFDRAMFLAALLLLWPAVRALHIHGVRDLGLRPDPHPAWHAALGLVPAAGLLWALGLIAWRVGVYAPRHAAFHAGDLVKIAFTAAAVATAEEAFFRGALQGLVGRTARRGAALVSVAALFAVLHFLKPPENALDHGTVNWLSGFAFLPKCFWQWGDARLVIGGFVTLFLVGLVLGWARGRTRALWLPIGLHAGWVFGLKTFSHFSRHTAPGNFLIGDDLLHGLAPVLVVLLTGGVVWLSLRREERDPLTVK